MRGLDDRRQHTSPCLVLMLLLALSGCDQLDQTGNQDSAARQKATESGMAETDSATQKQADSGQETADSGSEWTEPQASQPDSCAQCGTVSAIEPVVNKGDSTGIGVIAGGVTGGIVGNQIGGGTGKKIATVAGAVGGALAGNEVEKYVNSEKYYAVTVDMNNGGTRTVKIANGKNLSVGQKVKVDGNNLYLRES